MTIKQYTSRDLIQFNSKQEKAIPKEKSAEVGSTKMPLKSPTSPIVNIDVILLIFDDQLKERLEFGKRSDAFRKLSNQSGQ